MPDNVVLIMRFHPVHGEDFSVTCEDFGAESEALEAIAHALDAGRSLVLTRARYDRAADENGVVINLANVVSVRLSKTDSAATGQYLQHLSHPAVVSAEASKPSRRTALSGQFPAPDWLSLLFMRWRVQQPPSRRVASASPAWYLYAAKAGAPCLRFPSG